MSGAIEFTIGLAYLAAAIVFAFVGQRLAGRPVPAVAQLAATEFTIWWYGLAVMTGVLAFECLVASGGGLTFPLALTLYLFQLLVDSVLLWGLVAYLSYLYTGRYHTVSLGLFFGAFYLDALYYVVSQQPNGVVLTGGVPTIVYATTTNPLVVAFVVFGLLVPPFASAILYLSLRSKTRDPTLRYRITMVGCSILLFFVVAFFAPPANVVNPTVWTLAARLVDILAALLSLVAYYPPEWFRQRWGVHGVDHPAASDAVPPATPGAA